MIYSSKMKAIIGVFQYIRKKLQTVSIYYRIAIGNSLIIIFGAVGGTLVTRHLIDKAADYSLILLFATIGICLSVLINFFMLRSALHPLFELRRLVDQLKEGQTSIDPARFMGRDPDIAQLAHTLDSLVQLLKERNNQLKELSRRAITAQEEERKRIAFSLHDDTGQALTTLIFNLERIEDNLTNNSFDIQPGLTSSLQLARATLKELRKIIYGLRPTMLDDLGLVPAIRWYVRSNLEETGIQVKFDFSDNLERLPSELTTTLFRISQEAINNIVRHSNASSVEIHLFRKNGDVFLQVRDDGQGFDVAQEANRAIPKQQLGLLGIKERAGLVGGKVEIASSPGSGTSLEFRAPLHVEKWAQDE